jgi:hypothetical protein
MVRTLATARRVIKPVPHPLRSLLEDDEEEEDDSEEEDNPESSLWAVVGDPLKHSRHTMFKERQFTDFKLVCGGNEWHVHKCILFFAGAYFEKLFTSEWKECGSGNVEIPGKEISKPAFDSFLLFLYTGLVSSKNLKVFLFELYDLSVHFGVRALKKGCIQEFYDSLTTKNAETHLTFVSTRTHDLRLATMYAAFIAEHCSELVLTHFPFHKIGKTMLPLVFKRTVEVREHHSRYYHAKYPKRPEDEDEDDAELSGIGNPEAHSQYRLVKDGNYSDFKLNWNGNEYLLHRCVLSSECFYFRTFFNSEWKESNTGQVNLPQDSSISAKAFELFLIYCYTHLITKENLVSHFFELRELSDYFQVQSLMNLLVKGIQFYVTPVSAGKFLASIRERDLVELHPFLMNYIVDNLKKLVEVGFPFHKMGKIILTKLFKELVSGPISVNHETENPEDVKDEEIEEY